MVVVICVQSLGILVAVGNGSPSSIRFFHVRISRGCSVELLLRCVVQLSGHWLTLMLIKRDYICDRKAHRHRGL